MVLRGSHKQNQTFFTEVWNGSDGFRPMGVEAQPDFVSVMERNSVQSPTT